MPDHGGEEDHFRYHSICYNVIVYIINNDCYPPLHAVRGGGYSFTIRLYVCVDVCVYPLHNFANMYDINFTLGP